MVTVRVALRGWQGGPRASYDWAKVLLTLQQADSNSTATAPQLVLALRDAAGEHRPAHLPKHNGAGTASMRCPISLLIGRPTFLWSRGGPELKPFFFSFGRQAPDLQLQPPHHLHPFSPPQGDLRKGTLPKNRNPTKMSNQNESAAWPIADAALTQVRPARETHLPTQ